MYKRSILKVFLAAAGNNKKDEDLQFNQHFCKPDFVGGPFIIQRKM